MDRLKTRLGWGGRLGCEPRVGEAVGGRGSPLGHQVQHGQQEAAEAVRLLFGPLVFIHQDVEQAPRLQLGDVTQVTWDSRQNLSHVVACFGNTTSQSFGPTLRIQCLFFHSNYY